MASRACAATPTSSNYSSVGDGITGGKYWTSWTCDTIGNRQSQNQHALSTSTSDTVTTSTYSTTQPNTLTSTNTTGGATASTSYTYDPAGNTTNRNTTTGNTNYIYDADGKLLLQIDPATTTLYLGSEQITLTADTATGVRYYTAPGGATIVRTGTGSNYNFELPSDQHGTNTLYLDSTGQTPTWRQLDPYGNSRGTTTTWIDNRTFLNKPTDTTTALTSIGARHYDPALGRFISLDPLFEAADLSNSEAITTPAVTPSARAAQELDDPYAR